MREDGLRAVFFGDGIMSVKTVNSTSKTFSAIWDVLTDGLPAVITTHVRPDGDGVGSALALWHALRGEGVEACVALEPPIPSMFDFLPGMDAVIGAPDSLPATYNLVVIDCGTLERVGNLAPALRGRARTINIDHHASNVFFGDLNYVQGDASSCGEMLYGLLLAGEVPLTKPIAECLLTAIVADTGQFSHQDTTPAALQVGAACVEAGARPHVVVRELFCAPTPAQLRLQALAMTTLQFHSDSLIATMQVTEEMFRQTGLAPIDTGGFVEIVISVQGVEVAALLKEMPGCDYIKISMRSRQFVNVADVAHTFGGGGHKHAAGCEIYDTLGTAREAVLAELDRRVRDLPD